MHKSGSLETFRRITRKKENTMVIAITDSTSSSNTKNSTSNTTSTDPDSAEYYIDPYLKYDTEDLAVLIKEQEKHQEDKKTKEYWKNRNRKNATPQFNLTSSSPDAINSVLSSIRSTEMVQLQDSVLIAKKKRRNITPRRVERTDFSQFIVPIPETIQVETPAEHRSKRWRKGLSLSPRFLFPAEKLKPKHNQRSKSTLDLEPNLNRKKISKPFRTLIHRRKKDK